MPQRERHIAAHALEGVGTVAGDSESLARDSRGTRGEMGKSLCLGNQKSWNGILGGEMPEGSSSNKGRSPSLTNFRDSTAGWDPGFSAPIPLPGSVGQRWAPSSGQSAGSAASGDGVMGVIGIEDGGSSAL